MHYHVRSEAEANAIRPRVGDTVRQWSFKYKWTKHHRLPGELAPLRQRVDADADAVLRELALKPGADAYEAMAEIDRRIQDDPSLAAQYPESARMWRHFHAVPAWVDWAQIRRGQDVFFRYAGCALTGLLADSLLGGYGARRISEVLVRTGSFGVKSARRRLMQTTQWILEIMDSPESVRPGGEGWKSTVRVRILHAHVRQRMMARLAKDPAYLDVEENGLPINDLHQLVTMATFSNTLIDHTFPLMGITLSRRERDDYIALWRYIAHLLGLESDWFVDADRGQALLMSIVLSEAWPKLHADSPDRMGDEKQSVPPARILLDNSIAAITDTPPSFMTPEYIRAHLIYFHGRAYCRAALHMTEEEVSCSFLTRLTLLAKIAFFLQLDLACKFVPGWDARRLRRMRFFLKKVVVENGVEAGGLGGAVKIALEWLPSFTQTVADTTPHHSTRVVSAGRGVGMEKHYFTALALVTTVFGALVYATVRVGMAAVRYLVY